MRHMLLKLSSIRRPLKLCLVCYDLFKCLQSNLKSNLIKKYKEIEECRMERHNKSPNPTGLGCT